MCAGGTEAQRLERDFKQDHVAPIVHFGLSAPNCIEGRIISAVFGIDSVLLDAVRIGKERIGVAVIAKGVEEEAHLIVVINQFSAQHARSQEARFGVKSQKNDVKTFVGVTQIGLGPLRALSAILGLALNEFLHRKHLLGQRCGGRHAFEVAQLGRSQQPRHRQGVDLAGQNGAACSLGRLVCMHKGSCQQNRDCGANGKSW